LWRLPLSLGWLATLAIAFMLNLALNGHGGDGEVVVILAACMAGQWLLVQSPLWGLAVFYGVRLRHRSDPAETARDRQFGIRQLMILTAIVAVVLGACRWLVAATFNQFEGAANEAPVFILLAVAGIVMTLPLMMAALLPRFAWLATLVVLLLMALGTWYELPLVIMVGGGPNIWHLTFINAFQAVWVLAVVGALRLCGYGIGAAAGESPFASRPPGEILEFSPPSPKFSSPPADK
jgi:hypothetical protein